MRFADVLLVTCAALFSTAVFAACAPAPRRPSPKDPHVQFVARDGERFQGEFVVARFVVPQGCVAVVTGDFVLRADESVVIAGTLRAVDRGEHGEAVDVNGEPVFDAPNIEIVAGESIDIEGDVFGGNGRSFIEEPFQGGRGSTVKLRATQLNLGGEVAGGDAGSSGPGFSGARGGDVLVFCGVTATRPDRRGLIGGRGGAAGRTLDGPAPVPRAGYGGEAIAHADRDPRWK